MRNSSFLCVVGPKHCENTLCWMGMYVKLVCEIIPHLSKMWSVYDNHSSKKDLGVFWELLENLRYNRRIKGGTHSLFHYVEINELNSLSD